MDFETGLCQTRAICRKFKNCRTLRNKYSSSHLSCVEKVNKLTKEGPVYVRIICNICFYAKSVLYFKAGRSDMDVPEIECKYNATKQFVCRTCTSHFKRSRISSETV